MTLELLNHDELQRLLTSRIKQLETAVQLALEVLKLCTPNPRPTDDDYAEQGWKEHNAAIAALRAALHQQMEPEATLTTQRDALLEKIKAVIAAEQSEGSGCGGFIKRPPTREYQRRAIQAWQELHAAIKAVEGEK